jgi:acetyl-CoA carboxylase biotin carboxyl carrier protein
MATTRKSEKAAAAVRAKKTSNGTASAPAPDKNLAKLREIVKVLETSSLAELRYEDAEIAVEVRRYMSAPAHATGQSYSAPALAPAASAAVTRAAELAATAAAEAEIENDLHVVRSPFVGTFYSSPSPGAEKFCEAGKEVRRGQTICIIEAMKLMNEIESEVDGVVTAVLVENGKPVQYGDALLKIKTAK